MPLMRHIAGVPTPTEQRCVRCCEVIAELGDPSRYPDWPGQQTLGGPRDWLQPYEDCKPVDLNARGNMRIIDGFEYGPMAVELL